MWNDILHQTIKSYFGVQITPNIERKSPQICMKGSHMAFWVQNVSYGLHFPLVVKRKTGLWING